MLSKWGEYQVIRYANNDPGLDVARVWGRQGRDAMMIPPHELQCLPVIGSFYYILYSATTFVYHCYFLIPSHIRTGCHYYYYSDYCFLGSIA